MNMTYIYKCGPRSSSEHHRSAFGVDYIGECVCVRAIIRIPLLIDGRTARGRNSYLLDASQSMQRKTQVASVDGNDADRHEI